MQLRHLANVVWLSLPILARAELANVTSSSGVTYVGVRNTTTNQDIFLGIPYAKPPVGPLRFKPPTAWSPTSGTTLVNATVDKPICVQSTPIDYSPVSEDCLYLSLWKPSNVTTKLPVLVWIYGGGFLNGSALGYPGDHILTTSYKLNKPVLYVAMNYRLGVYGFPPGQQSEAAGALNLGLKDQRLALEWVNKNIGLFGGDPSKVMIFGESAGAMSVAYQMLYKDGNTGGIFRAALMQSGAPSTYAAKPASYPPRQAAYNFIANATGCATSNFECLRNANADTLRQANYDVVKVAANLRAPDPYPAAIGPTLSSNDLFLPRPPRQSVKNGKFAKIPFVCGTNLDEGTIFTTNPSTTSELVSFLTTQHPGLTFGLTNTTAVNEMLKYYPADPSAGSPYNTGNDTFGRAAQYKRAASVVGDLVFDIAASSGVPTWSYQFAQTGLDAPEYGAAHSFELLFVLQYLEPETPQNLVDLSVVILDHWLALAYNLDPSIPSTKWPKYSTSSPQSLQFKAGNTTVIPDTFRSAGPDQTRSHDLASTSPNRHNDSKAAGERGPKTYPHRLNFYDDPPLCNVTLEEFETWGIQRLRVLAEIESCSVRNRTFEDTKQVTQAQCKKHLPLSATSALAVDRDAERKMDHVSHFVLRLAFCRSEELRRRFVKAETMLFKIRWETDDRNERARFLGSLDIGISSVPEEEIEPFRKDLANASGLRPKVEENQPKETYCKVHWTRVTDLVATRRVFLKGGYAYVPAHEQSSIVFQEFSSRLERALEQTSRAVPRLDEDDRLVPLLNHLAQSFLTGIASSSAASFADENGENVRAEQVDELATRHFPACMRNLHDALRKDHHLRHHGRLQYGLFLKAIGMSVEEALTFWRRGFQGGKVSDDKFAKEYRYNIRHSYGLEGRRMNYPAKNCIRIITNDEPTSLDNHGCPFRHFSSQNLTAMLERSYRITSTSEQAEIAKLVKGNHFQVACTRVFELTHRAMGVKAGDGLDGGETVDHPNRYYTRSKELAKDKEPKDRDGMDLDQKPAREDSGAS
ncbi:carbohydrate esterase family 10 protein [Ceratobasidium sp. AG-Ba]|nr:carbohydrate esterase family 10 protein [Ceratobasidium sp. AG-Ba]